MAIQREDGARLRILILAGHSGIDHCNNIVSSEVIWSPRPPFLRTGIYVMIRPGDVTQLDPFDEHIDLNTENVQICRKDNVKPLQRPRVSM